MNSIITWIGGKKLLRKEIVKRFPEEGFTRYVEVFGGAGWVLFEKEQGKELEVFNDRDSNLINFFWCFLFFCFVLFFCLLFLFVFFIFFFCFVCLFFW